MIPVSVEAKVASRIGMNTSVGCARSHLGSVNHDADRDDGQSRSVQHEEHDHRVAGCVFFRVQFLKAFHGFQSQRRGRIVQSQHIGRDVHENVSDDGMVLGNVREELAEEWAEAACQNVDHSAFFPDFHDAHPKREHAGQAEGNLESRLGGTERGVHDGRKHAGIACEYQLPCRDEECDAEECHPDVIQNHRNLSLHD